MRIHGLKRSENENLGIMNANSSFDILCKFEDPNDLERKKYLDDKLNMNKEAENLYKEITKFIFHNESDFIDCKGRFITIYIYYKPKHNIY